MTKNEEFEKWDEENDKLNLPVPMRILAAWNARQPEIDALKDHNKRLAFHNKNLQAEVEKLRADAERLDWLEAHPRLGEIHVDGEVKDCYLYAVSGAPGVPMRAIIDATKETK